MQYKAVLTTSPFDYELDRVRETVRFESKARTPAHLIRAGMRALGIEKERIAELSADLDDDMQDWQDGIRDGVDWTWGGNDDDYNLAVTPLTEQEAQEADRQYTLELGLRFRVTHAQEPLFSEQQVREMLSQVIQEALAQTDLGHLTGLMTVVLEHVD